MATREEGNGNNSVGSFNDCFIVKMGSLKKDGRGWIGGWKPRYFVLNSLGELSYYESEMAFLSNPVMPLYLISDSDSL